MRQGFFASAARRVRLEGEGALVLAGFRHTFRLAEKVQLGAEGLLPFYGNHWCGEPCGQDVVGVAIVGKTVFQNAGKSAFERGVFDRDHQFNATVEIARHPVGRGNEDGIIAPLVKGENAGVFEVAIDDGNDFDIF